MDHLIPDLSDLVTECRAELREFSDAVHALAKMGMVGNCAHCGEWIFPAGGPYTLCGRCHNQLLKERKSRVDAALRAAGAATEGDDASSS